MAKDPVRVQHLLQRGLQTARLLARALQKVRLIFALMFLELHLAALQELEMSA